MSRAKKYLIAGAVAVVATVGAMIFGGIIGEAMTG